MADDGNDWVLLFVMLSSPLAVLIMSLAYRVV